MKLFLLALAALILSGCQTAQRGATENVRVSVFPRSATVTNSLGLPCRNPCVLKVRRRKAFTVTAKARGYRTQTVQVKTVVNKKALTRTLGSFIVPGGSALVAIDTISGATRDHKPNPVIIRLRRR